MKLTLHAGLFAMGTVEVDTETGQWRFLVEPLINADQGVTANGEPIDPADAMKAGNVCLAVLNKAVADWILKRAGLDATLTSPGDESPPVNVWEKMKGSA